MRNPPQCQDPLVSRALLVLLVLLEPLAPLDLTVTLVPWVLTVQPVQQVPPVLVIPDPREGLEALVPLELLVLVVDPRAL